MLSQSAASVVATMFPGLICFCNPTIFIEKDLDFAHFPKHSSIWDLCPSVNPNHTRMPEEVCAERLTGPGKQLLNLLVLGEVSLPLINFRTNTLSQKHFQCQHSCVDICILKWFQLLYLFLKIFSGSCIFSVALKSFCLSCLRRCGYAANGRTW